MIKGARSAADSYFVPFIVYLFTSILGFDVNTKYQIECFTVNEAIILYFIFIF